MNDFDSPSGDKGINNLKESLRRQDEKIRAERGKVSQEAGHQEQELKHSIHDPEGNAKKKTTELTLSAEKLRGLNVFEANIYFPRGPKGFAPYGYFEALTGNKEDEFIREIKLAAGVNKDVLGKTLNFFVGAGLIHESVAKKELPDSPHLVAKFRSIPVVAKGDDKDPPPHEDSHQAAKEHQITKPLVRLGVKGEFEGPLGTNVDYIGAKEFWGGKPAYYIAEADVTKPVGKNVSLGMEVLSESNVTRGVAFGPIAKFGPVQVGISASPDGGWKAYVRFHKKPH